MLGLMVGMTMNIAQRRIAEQSLALPGIVTPPAGKVPIAEMYRSEITPVYQQLGCCR
jgi:hypothetical protein